jgi:glycosyltransferase involved in cell wall biosynthesis
MATMADTRIFCITLVKNEADIIGQCLTAAQAWAHRIYVYDNGSSDGTWERVLELAARHPAIVPFRQDGKVFDANMRQEVFEAYRDQCRRGDWWCVLDADEFYMENPALFLDKVPNQFKVVQNFRIDFVMTEKDISQYEMNPKLYDAETPIQDRIRYYKAWRSEVRFFRHEPDLSWPKGYRSPLFGAFYRDRIPTLHYRQRSPEQLQRRIDTRKDALLRGTKNFKHEIDSATDWRGQLSRSTDPGIHYYAGDGLFIIDEKCLREAPLSARMPAALANAARHVKPLVRVVRDAYHQMTGAPVRR